MNIEKLANALDNDNNEGIMNLTTKKIAEMNYNIVKELHLGKTETLNFLKKIKGYRYIDEIHELKYGSYVRWIPIFDPTNIPLNYNGIVCEIKIMDDGVLIVCKNFMHRHYSFKMEESLIFQRLTDQELVILSALDHINDDNNYHNDSYDNSYDNSINNSSI